MLLKNRGLWVGFALGKSPLAKLRHPEVPRFDQRDEGSGAGNLGSDMLHVRSLPRRKYAKVRDDGDLNGNKLRVHYGMEIAVAACVPAHGYGSSSAPDSSMAMPPKSSATSTSR
jgi:hypothetical protein